jgi:hypothetical protein
MRDTTSGMRSVYYLHGDRRLGAVPAPFAHAD